MYRRDCLEIRDHAIESPMGFVDVVEFTLCSIQAGLSTIKNQRKDIAINGLSSKYLWGSKADGLEFAMNNRQFYWGKLCELAESPDDYLPDAMELMLKVPCLGLPKAAFVCQMYGFNVGCIDSHNLKRFGLSPNVTTINKKAKPKTVKRRTREYIEISQRISTSELWWDGWCSHVAGNSSNKDLDTADLVSRYHVQAVKM